MVGLSLVYPPNDDLFVENAFWNGLSEAYRLVKPVRLGGLSGLGSALPNPSEGTLLIIGPSKPFVFSDIETVYLFMRAGGTVVLADDFGSGNTLLQVLPVEARFQGQLMMDQLFKERNAVMPRAVAFSGAGIGAGLGSLVLNYPTVLTGVNDGQVLAWSSLFSYLGSEAAKPTPASKYGPYPLVAEVKMGAGRLVLISDPSMFINGMLELGDNRALLERLTRGKVAIDESHMLPSRLTAAKALLIQAYTVLGSAELKYGIAVAAVIGVFKVKWGEEEVEAVDEVEEVLRRRPEWSREELEHLKKLRGEYRGSN